MSDVVITDIRTGEVYSRDYSGDEQEEITERLVAASPASLRPLSAVDFHTMLNLTGHDADLETYLMAIKNSDPVLSATGRAKLKFSKSFHRDDPLVAALALAIGLTSEQVDTLWAAAQPEV